MAVRELVEEMEEVARQPFLLYSMSDFIEAAQKDLREEPNKGATSKEKAKEKIEVVDFEGNPIVEAPYSGNTYSRPTWGLGQAFMSFPHGVYERIEEDRARQASYLKANLTERENKAKRMKHIEEQRERLRAIYEPIMKGPFLGGVDSKKFGINERNVNDSKKH